MPSLLLTLLLALSPPNAGRDDVVLPIPRFEATTRPDGDGDWSAIAIDGHAGDARWLRARARFEMPADFEAGDWMLCVGPPASDLSATLNGTPLERIPDRCAEEPWLAAGPRFLVSSFTLRTGPNLLELGFAGSAAGRGFERGPAYLLSRLPAERLRVSAAVSDLVVSIANFATLATTTRSNHLLDRIAFKSADDGGEPRLAGQLDLAVVGRARDAEIPLRELSGRRLAGGFPAPVLELEDPRLPSFHGRIRAGAPLLTTPLRLSDAKCAGFEIQQNSQGGGFSHLWIVRFFPAVGGPLRVVRGERWILLRNERVGVFVEEGRLLGSEEAPTGIAVVIERNTQGQRALGGVARRCGVIGYEQEGLDPSQADDMEDLVESFLGHDTEDADATTRIAGDLACEPVEGKAVPGVATRASAVATLAGMRQRGTRFLYSPPAGAQSAEAFWADTFTLLHFPLHERNAIEWLLSTQDEAGAIHGDLPADATPAELAGADAYAVLRACRWLRWRYDGERFLALAPKLARALAHADGVDVLAPTAPPPERERLSGVHLALARAAAHRELAAALGAVGGLADVAAASAQAATDQLDRLLRPADQGGRAADAGFVDLPDEDPREAAFALAFALLSDERARALAGRLGEIAPHAGPLDWRDALVVRALLRSGAVAALGKRWERLDQEVRSTALPSSSASAAYHGALCFGLLGIRRDTSGTIEMRPRLVERQSLRTGIPLPDGSVRVQILPVGQQLEHQLIVQNDTTSELAAVIGLCGAVVQGRREKVGEVVYRLHDQRIAAGEAWRELLR